MADAGDRERGSEEIEAVVIKGGIKKAMQGAHGHAKIRRGMELKREQWEAAEGRTEGFSSTGLGEGRSKDQV